MLLESEEFESVLHRIQAECSEFIEAPIQLIRGVSDSFDVVPVQSIPIRTDRQSRSGKHIGTKLFNRMFEDHFNVSDVRNKAAFVTNSMREAQRYGTPMYVFPVNGSQITFDPNFSDTMSLVGELWFTMIDAIKPSLSKDDVAVIRRHIPILDDPKSSTSAWDDMVDELSDAAADAVEKTYAALSDGTMQHYTVSPTVLLKEIDRPVEYMLFGAAKYYAVNCDWAERLVRDLPGEGNTHHKLIQHLRNL